MIQTIGEPTSPTNMTKIKQISEMQPSY